MAPSRTFAILAVAAAAFAALQSLLNPVLQTIQQDLNTSQSTVTWVLTVWLMSAAIATPLLGRAGDMVGKKRALLLALGAVVAGSLICAIAPNVGVLLIGRVLQGLGGAVFPLSFGIIRDEFPAERVPSAIGAMAAVLSVFGGVGTILAGPIVGALSWRWLFWLPMIVELAAAALVWRFVPESPSRTGGRINWFAASLLAGWLVALLLPLSKGAGWGWSSDPVLGLFALAIVLFLAWVYVESRAGEPVIDLKMMRLPAVWTTNLVALLFGASMFAIYAFVPRFAQTSTATGYGFGLSITQSGLILLPLLVTMGIAGLLSARIPVSFKAQLGIGSAFGAIAAAGLAFFHHFQWEVAFASGVFGLGLGLVYASMSSLIIQGVAPDQTGVASGMNTNIRNIGGAVGTALFSSLITGTTQATGLPAETGYTQGFLLFAVVGFAAVAVSLIVPGRRPQAVPVPA
ncbi:MFS transporter [Actinocrispum sp. NPDC049592]|uniref:MFS transporter n=1 Tax=Actinocrispum sp. NPDC049592 TaxID=3154835 RepID=UPI003448B26E